MPLKLLSADDFRAAAEKDGETPDGAVFKYATSESEQVGEAEARTERFTFSDATVDHANDSIDPKGWQLGVFKSNPVALFSHMSWDPPIGRASNVSVKDGKLSGDIEFADEDVYPFADTIYRLVKAKFLRAVSVGFKPVEWAFTSDKSRPYGINFTKQTLLEISICAIPANPAALSEARSVGIDTAPLQEWAERVLDSGDVIFMPRKDVEALRLQSKTGAVPQYYISGDRDLSAKGLERMRESFKRWREDPNELLILEPGFALREVKATETVAEPIAPEDGLETTTAEETGENNVTKAGRRVSAATKAKLQEAMDHHEAMGKCIKDLMDGDGPDDEPDGDPDNTLVRTAPDEVVETVVIDPDAGLTPEQRRLKEVADLRASLPKAD